MRPQASLDALWTHGFVRGPCCPQRVRISLDSPKRRPDVKRELDDVLGHALTTFSQAIHEGGWRGRREREAVSYFAFGHLVPLCRSGQSLHHPAQIGLEVAVPG